MIRISILLLLSCVFSATAEEPRENTAIHFQRTQLDKSFRSEGVAVADLNNDGLMDIAAGFVWYAAPDWKIHSITPDLQQYDPKHYSNAFVTFAKDMNRDGRTDIVVVDFPGTPTWWFENPEDQSQPWRRHIVTPVSNNESPQFVDVTGDGKRNFVMAVNPDKKNPDGPLRQMAYLTPPVDPKSPWGIQAISELAAPSTTKYSHGLGVGDVNNDGRRDILVKSGWWEAPQVLPQTKWQFHTADFGEDCSHIYVYDFDGDGDQDVLSASAHRYGIWWHEQEDNGLWKRHTIDDTFSQTHSVMMVDMNGDGLQDFVTGKRWWAHGGKDPGGNEPAMLYWFELQRTNGSASWKRHEIDHNSGIGTQFEIADVNGDSLPDIVTSNKKGVFLFQQTRSN